MSEKVDIYERVFDVSFSDEVTRKYAKLVERVDHLKSGHWKLVGHKLSPGDILFPEHNHLILTCAVINVWLRAYRLVAVLASGELRPIGELFSNKDADWDVAAQRADKIMRAFADPKGRSREYALRIAVEVMEALHGSLLKDYLFLELCRQIDPDAADAMDAADDPEIACTLKEMMEEHEH